jgi:hypothetical protein
MKKPTKKRPADVNTRMHSILGEVIAISNQPITKPAKPAKPTKKRSP